MTTEVDRAAELLAREQVRQREKRALAPTLGIEHLGQYGPYAGALSGALLGAGLGMALSSASQRGQKKKRRGIPAWLIGSLAGAGLGYGLIRGTDQLAANLLSQPIPVQGKGKIDVSRATPEALSTALRQLQKDPESVSGQVGTTLGRLLSSAYDAVAPRLPVSRYAVPAITALDFLAHNPWAGLLRIRPEQATGRVGRDLLIHGLEHTPAVSTLSDPLRRAIVESQVIKSVLQPGASPSQPGLHAAPLRLGKRTIDPVNMQVLDYLLQRGIDRGAPGDPLLAHAAPPSPEATVEISSPQQGNQPRQPKPQFKPRIRIRGSVSDLQAMNIPLPGGVNLNLPPETSFLTRAQREQIMRSAYQEHPYYSGRTLYRLPGTNLSYYGARTWLGALLPRLVYMLGLPSAEMLFHAAVTEPVRRALNQRRVMRELVEQGVLKNK